MSITVRSFGQSIRANGAENPLSQQDIAQRIETPVPYIALLESGTRHPFQGSPQTRRGSRVARELFIMANPLEPSS
jgi:ribosome-binding protein aMBF1 (putative translation factor)